MMMAMDWVVYLVRCADGTLYCGISNQPKARFHAHRTGKGARYTRSRGAEEMRIIACCLNRSTATQAEHRLKRLSRQQKMCLWQTATPIKLL